MYIFTNGVKNFCAILQVFSILPKNKGKWAVLDGSAVTPALDLKFRQNNEAKYLVLWKFLFWFIF